MKTLYATAVALMLMLIAVPNADELATSPTAPTYTHFVYMFGHATFLHWFINAWSLLLLHNTFRWYRLLVSYLLAVLVSFVPCAEVVPQSLIGLSAITMFFFGLITPYLWQRNKSAVWMMIGILLAGFFIPHIAALLHITIFMLGLAYYYIERFIRNLFDFIREE